MNAPFGVPDSAQKTNVPPLAQAHMTWVRATFLDLYQRAEVLERLVRSAYDHHDDGTSIEIHVDRDAWATAEAIADTPRPALPTDRLSEEDARRLVDAVMAPHQSTSA